MIILDQLAALVAFVLREIHRGLSTFLEPQSGWAWGLSVVLLTITVRIALFPLFVKQIRSQRRMAELAPKIKALQVKHKGDRETLNVELMKLYKDHGTNPIAGCMPLLLQLPIFFALFRVMNEFKPNADGSFDSKFGLSSSLIDQAARAKVVGAPISAAFNSSADTLAQLGGERITVQVVATLLIVTMGLTTFITQKQMMARAGAVTDPQQVMVQKVMLYVLPFSFAVFGFSLPIGVLLYWLTTNLWSMAQQRYVIARMPPVGSAPAAEPRAEKRSRLGSVLGTGRAADPVPAPSLVEAQPAVPAGQPAARPGTSNHPNRPPGKSSKKSAGSRKNKNKKRR